MSGKRAGAAEASDSEELVEASLRGDALAPSAGFPSLFLEECRPFGTAGASSALDPERLAPSSGDRLEISASLLLKLSSSGGGSGS